MGQSPSWEANSCIASQEIPHLLQNPNEDYCVHNIPLSVPTLSQMNPVKNFIPSFP
jgi:hypothetical protein